MAKKKCTGRGRPQGKKAINEAYEKVKRAEVRLKNAEAKYDYVVDMSARCGK